MRALGTKETNVILFLTDSFDQCGSVWNYICLFSDKHNSYHSVSGSLPAIMTITYAKVGKACPTRTFTSDEERAFTLAQVGTSTLKHQRPIDYINPGFDAQPETAVVANYISVRVRRHRCHYSTLLQSIHYEQAIPMREP